MFYRGDKTVPSSKQTNKFKDLETIHSAETLIKDKKRQVALKHIKHNLAYPLSHYQTLILPLLAQVALYYQQLPGTSLYFGQPGGALDRAVYRSEAALTIMRQLMIHDDSSKPSEEQKIWLYAVFSASLLQGIGKLYSEYQIEIHNHQGLWVKSWQPLLETMPEVGNFYRYKFVREDSDSETLRRQVTVLLAQQLLPKAGLALLSAHPPIFKLWLSCLEEDRDGAGVLAAILDRADAFAVQRYLSEYLEEFGHLLEPSGPQIGSFLDNTPEHSVERDRVIGAEFLLWIRDALATGKIILNQAPFRAEIYPTGVVLSAETYDMFLQEHLKLKSKFIVQRAVSAWNSQNRLEQSQIAVEKAADGKLYLDNAVIPDMVKIQDPKTGHISNVRSLDLVNDMRAYSRDYAAAPIKVESLDRQGKWSSPNEAPIHQPLTGVNHRG